MGRRKDSSHRRGRVVPRPLHPGGQGLVFSLVSVTDPVESDRGHSWSLKPLPPPKDGIQDSISEPVSTSRSVVYSPAFESVPAPVIAKQRLWSSSTAGRANPHTPRV